MNKESFDLIVLLAEADIANGNLTDLYRLKEFLETRIKETIFENKKIFYNPELEQKKELLTMDLQGVLPLIGGGIGAMTVYSLQQAINRQQGWEYDESHVYTLAHLIQLDADKLYRVRGLGNKKKALITAFLEENGLHFGMIISKEENDLLLEYMKEKATLDGHPPKTL